MLPRREKTYRGRHRASPADAELTDAEIEQLVNTPPPTLDEIKRGLIGEAAGGDRQAC